MDIAKVQKTAEQIYKLHLKYTLGTDITFDVIDPAFTMGFCRVHRIWDDRYIVGVSPMSEMYSEGEIEITGGKGYEQMKLLIKTDFEKAGKLAEMTLKEVLKKLKKTIKNKGVTPQEIITEKQKRIAELKGELKKLEGGEK